MEKVQTLKGFRDINPEEALKRGRVLSLLKSVFKTYGFAPMETPTLEYAELIEKEVGKEMQKLIYKFKDRGERWIALRAEHTPSLARFVAQNYNNITFPFKRYQIGNIFRAEKPQAGRFREFTQVDVDTVGADTALADAEMIALMATSFQLLGVKNFVILINDRTLFRDLPVKAIRILDKLEKIGRDKVKKELDETGLDSERILNQTKDREPSPRLREIFSLLKSFGIPDELWKFDPLLARGLDYYTGAVFEVKLEDHRESLAGGGRYDNLIGNLIGEKVPAVGFAFGLDRVVEATPKETFSEIPFQPKALVTIFSPNLLDQTIRLFTQIQGQGTEVELYLDPTAKLNKQLKYADRKGITYAVILGPEEVKSNQVTLKNLKKGTQQTFSLDSFLKTLSLG